MNPLPAVCCQRNADPLQQRAEIDALVQAGANVQEADKNGVTPLHHAVRFRSPAAVEALLRHGAAVNRQCQRSGATPLHRAVLSTGAPGTAGKDAEAKAIVALLLKFGADPSIRNNRGKTAADYPPDDEARRLFGLL